MALNQFDRKFGEEFIKTLPTGPAVYRMYDAAGDLVYVGKAKNLRRRISQYRNAKRRRIHRKMNTIVKTAQKFEFELCDTEAHALRLELKLIQTHRPKLNVASSFFFLYPMIGIKTVGKSVHILVTTMPDSFEGFNFYGCFRSRLITREAFAALGRFFYFLGTVKELRHHRLLYAREFKISGMEGLWQSKLHDFLMGKSRVFLEDIFQVLLQKSGAHQRRAQVQEDFEALDLFWRREVMRLQVLCRKNSFSAYPLPQSERDMLLLNMRIARQSIGVELS